MVSTTHDILSFFVVRMARRHGGTAPCACFLCSAGSGWQGWGATVIGVPFRRCLSGGARSSSFSDNVDDVQSDANDGGRALRNDSR